jgi:hypothetical protein
MVRRRKRSVGVLWGRSWRRWCITRRRRGEMIPMVEVVAAARSGVGVVGPTSGAVELSSSEMSTSNDVSKERRADNPCVGSTNRLLLLVLLLGGSGQNKCHSHMRKVKATAMRTGTGQLRFLLLLLLLLVMSPYVLLSKINAEENQVKKKGDW